MTYNSTDSKKNKGRQEEKEGEQLINCKDKLGKKQKKSNRKKEKKSKRNQYKNKEKLRKLR